MELLLSRPKPNVGPDVGVAANRPALTSTSVLASFALALFTSSLLMFSVQPMFTKMVLPVLGGSPGVWSVAMVFFQGTLMIGYLYADWINRHLAPGTARLAHAAVLVAALATLPLHLPMGWGEPPATGTAFWLIGLFALATGLPFFALAANGPLLQAWFARSGHPRAADPYFLYGASNLGSFCGLLLYPLVFEPTLELGSQTRLWGLVFGLMAALIAVIALRHPAPANQSAGVAASKPLAAPVLPWKACFGFAMHAGVPSGLLVAVTAQLSTDVAAAPLLWVLPLALFLLTFTLTFAREQPVPHKLMLALQPWAVAAAILVQVLSGLFSLPLVVGLILACYFICSMVSHGELYRSRPDAANLTRFYLWMSAGGVLGGIFCALIAPVIFTSVLEYPILLLGTLLCRPEFARLKIGEWVLEAASLAAAAIVVVALTRAGLMPTQFVEGLGFAMVIAALAIGIGTAAGGPGRLMGLTAAALILTTSLQPADQHILRARSFFGVHKIVDGADGVRGLFHGTTLHGAERIDPATARPLPGRPDLVGYYYPGGGYDQALQYIRSQSNGRLADVATIGLGTGGLACEAMPGETWRFFEIDPEVIRIATDPALFSFIQACAPSTTIVQGDARLTLRRDAHLYDAIVVDAFSSDAVPAHLLTREAISEYLDKLKPGGKLAMAVTNRHLDLKGVVASTAASLGLNFAVVRAKPSRAEIAALKWPSTIMVLSRSSLDGLDDRTRYPDWTLPAADPAIAAWTDSYSNQLAAIWRKMREEP